LRCMAENAPLNEFAATRIKLATGGRREIGDCRKPAVRMCLRTVRIAPWERYLNE